MGILEPQLTDRMDKMRVIIVHTHNSLNNNCCVEATTTSCRIQYGTQQKDGVYIKEIMQHQQQ
jgi:hypothetical protein